MYCNSCKPEGIEKCLVDKLHYTKDKKQSAQKVALEDLIPGKPDILAKHIMSKCADASEEAKGEAKTIIMAVKKQKEEKTGTEKLDWKMKLRRDWQSEIEKGGHEAWFEFIEFCI